MSNPDPKPNTSAAAPSHPSAEDILKGRSRRERERMIAEIEARLPDAFALDLRGRRPQTIGLFVSQYWNDEADDAVHIEYRYAFDAVSDPAQLTRFDDDGEDENEYDEARSQFEDRLYQALPGYNSNDELITAFASYACESDQESLEYVPYCLWQRRDGGGVRTDVGTMRRPEWEDAVHQYERASFPRSPPPLPVRALLVGVAVAALLAAWRFLP